MRSPQRGAGLRARPLFSDPLSTIAVKTQNTYNVSVPPRGSASAIHAAIAEIDANPPQSVRLWAGSLNFATPREICGLRALIDRTAAYGNHVIFDCPRDLDVHRYLERVDFYENLPANVELSEPRPVLRRQNRNSHLIELLTIRSGDDVARLMARVHELARGEFGPERIA